MTDKPVPLRPERGRRADGLPPHDIAAEEALLAALLLDEEALPRAQAIVSARDFFCVAHRSVYEAMESAAERGEEITHPVVAHELERAGRLDEVGGIAFLFQLTGEYFTAAGVEAHARIVARDAMYRRMIDAAARIQARAQEGGPDADGALAEAEELLAALPSGRSAGHFRRLSDLLSDFVADDAQDADGTDAAVD